MPKFYPNQLISDCWSSVGNITFYHRNGACYWKTKPQPVFPGTAAQLRQLDVHKRALAAWSGIPDTDKHLWNDMAKPVLSHRPPFGIDGRVSGYNLFVSAYHGFAVLGSEHIPAPQPFRPFPIFALRFIAAEIINDVSLRLKYEMNVDDNFSPEDYAVLGKLQLTAAGRGYNPGKMRNALASSVVMKARGKFEVEFLIDDYVSFCGINADSYSVHGRFILIDRVQGYRSQYQKLSGVVLLG